MHLRHIPRRFLARRTSSLLFGLLAYSALCASASAQRVVINEVFNNPEGGVPTNSVFINDPCDRSAYGTEEWVELYNPHPCEPIDVSCYIVGSNMGLDQENQPGANISLCQNAREESVQMPNRGFVALPEGTVIPPQGFLTVGGGDAFDLDVPLAQYRPQNSSNFCGSPRYYLNSTEGWVGVFDPNGQPVDAVFWTSGGMNDIQSRNTFDNPDQINCLCAAGRTLNMPSAKQLFGFGQIRWAGSTDAEGYRGEGKGELFRNRDGGCWDIVNFPTPNDCNKDCQTREWAVIAQTKTEICEGDELVLRAEPIYDPRCLDMPVRYEWRVLPDGPPVEADVFEFAPTEDAAIQMTGYWDEGCIVQDVVEIKVTPAVETEFEISATDVCLGDSVDVRYTGELSDDATFIWSFGNGAGPSPAPQGQSGPFRVAWDVPGRKTLSVTARVDRCNFRSPEKELWVYSSSGVTISADSACFGDSTRVLLNGMPPRQVEEWQLALRDWDWLPDSSGISATFPRSGVYPISMIPAPVVLRCLDSVPRTTAVVKPKPAACLEILPPRPGHCELSKIYADNCLDAEGAFLVDTSDLTFTWDYDEGVFPNGDSLARGPRNIYWEETGTKLILLTAELNGCVSDTLQFVHEYEPDFGALYRQNPPNAFSPNNDGRNDVYEIIGLNRDCATFTCKIFNRWGKLVATLDELNPVWDGTWNGVQAPESVYVFVMDIRMIDGITYQRKGTITLIR